MQHKTKAQSRLVFESPIFSTERTENIPRGDRSSFHQPSPGTEAQWGERLMQQAAWAWEAGDLRQNRGERRDSLNVKSPSHSHSASRKAGKKYRDLPKRSRYDSRKGKNGGEHGRIGYSADRSRHKSVGKSAAAAVIKSYCHSAKDRKRHTDKS